MIRTKSFSNNAARRDKAEFFGGRLHNRITRQARLAALLSPAHLIAESLEASQHLVDSLPRAWGDSPLDITSDIYWCDYQDMLIDQEDAALEIEAWAWLDQQPEYERCHEIRATDGLDCMDEPDHYGRHRHEHVSWTDSECVGFGDYADEALSPTAPLDCSWGVVSTYLDPRSRAKLRGPGNRPVWDVAREVGVPSNVLITYLRNTGEYVTCASSHIPAPVIDRVLADLAGR